MRNSLILPGLLLLILFSTQNAGANISVPSNPIIENPAFNTQPSLLEKLLALTPKEFEIFTGRHLSLKQKISFKLLKWRYKKAGVLTPGETLTPGKYEKMAKKAMIFGIGAFVLVFIPFVGLLAIPSAILAIVLGAVSIGKVEKKTNSILGIIFGSLLLALIVLALIVFTTSYY